MQQPTLDHLPKCSSLVENETESTSDAVLEEIIDEVILGLCFEVHRACRLGFFLLDEPKEDEKKYEIVDEIGLDVFGQVPLKKQFDCVCPNCQRNLAASRFAPHLEKCMGMGRNSSRIASKRIANTGKVESDVDDYDNDSDWNYTSDRKGRPQITGSKKKREKNSPRRTKIKGKNGEGSGTNTASSEGLNMFANYETLSIEERKSLLIQMCGVISEHTKKMCTRSHRCPQHSEEQRKSVRSFLLGKANQTETVDDLVDVDTLEESDSQSLRDSVNRLWESSNSTNPSPADSASTASGSSSTKKKEKRPVFNSGRNVISKKNKAKISQVANSATTNQAVLNLLGADIA